MLLKLITVSALSIGLATSAMAQSNSGSTSGTSGAAGVSGSGVESNNNPSPNSTSNTEKDSQGKKDSSDCVQGKTATNNATKTAPGVAANAAGNCQ
ncbi:hypothetical protein HGP14_34430 [Rhizobium sp. P32RR-XVIII]|uniref:hypothetical protein n=1 Tax=Rhizobium sp. P32RR-XVIII TaxID=2726738 RepID=UPI001457905E|nr:hypothetical protein [Rhizobium sp. P32RR-XVIII]NLS08285.1 hypothetical protein [Rhizobium sp. P32RR-XVIII]